MKEHFDKLPKKVPSDLKVWEDAIGMIQNSYMMTEEEDEWGGETGEEDFATKELEE